MITYLIISGTCLLISILLFLQYNSGSGGALGSFKKRFTYFFSIVFFIVFIFTGNKAYYYSNNHLDKMIRKELLKEYSEFEKMIIANKKVSDLKFQEKHYKIKELIEQLNIETHKEFDTYITILTNILSAFIAWVIVFTFRNRILG